MMSVQLHSESDGSVSKAKQWRSRGSDHDRDLAAMTAPGMHSLEKGRNVFQGAVFLHSDNMFHVIISEI